MDEIAWPLMIQTWDQKGRNVEIEMSEETARKLGNPRFLLSQQALRVDEKADWELFG